MTNQIQSRIETLGPAEQIIRTLTSMTDHLVHNRPGIVSPNGSSVGVLWTPCTYVIEDGVKVVYSLPPSSTKTRSKTRVGVLGEDNIVRDGEVVKGTYRVPNAQNKLFPEVAAYLYRQVAGVFQMDQEFAARWASYTFRQGKSSSEDLKVVLAAFLLVQPRCGQPVIEDGEVLFLDDDYRDVGEAMFLIRDHGGQELSPKLVKRIGDFLRLPEIIEINRELGFVKSGRSVPMGRYDRAVTRWLRYREHNPKMLEGLVKAGYTSTVKALARRVHYKPESSRFFQILGWSQKANEHREVAIGEQMVARDTWDDLDEKAVCARIIKEKPGYKRLVGMYHGGWTPAILAACIESGSFSDKDLILLVPTFEDFGLMEKEPFKTLISTALAKAEDQRAANIARNVRTKSTRDALEDAADKATARALTEVTRNLRVYCMVDKSGSMDGAIERAITYLTKFLGGFPLSQLHVAVFNTQGTEVSIKAPKAVAVQHAFQGHKAGGGTLYAKGVEVLQKYKPGADEDVLFLFVGDSAGEWGVTLAQTIRASGLNPMAFGFLKVVSGWGSGNTVETAAQHLNIPCFSISESMFTSDDPYAVTRILRDMISATPVAPSHSQMSAAPRVTLIEQILKTPLLQKPVWASAA